ncbi:MAG: radical SAM protein [Peptoniphilus lacydonensis]|uniref:radical SAM protein n=1 Tax=Peptoniphilus TaxID=162289 RepID=UPI0029018B9B|nr:MULTISPECIES: radical SAM protein [Peptoniphilus]MDU1954863.1 radical SAM protein [Peptoniphilus lacydonensis]MDU5274330.1 radical SAM protein [Peptoniphilus lacydonensis]MDU5595142.1 radical SAM protein [Peptoniphilus rhinitidis]
MNRYSKINNKNKREIVLLKARSCKWGKCTFCDYIYDNEIDEEKIDKINLEVLKNVTGEYGVLEVIDSASVFDLTQKTLEEIKRVVEDKNIKKLFFEAHWIYRNRLDEIREFFNVPIIFKTGIETFDNDFREEVLKKGADFKDYREVKKYFDSPCVMVGIKGQTKEMIDRDMEIIKKFPHATVNIFMNNSTNIKRDEELVEWFVKKYKYLEDDPNVDILFEITDFGVG